MEQEQLIRQVTEIGNGAHIFAPKEWIGERVLIVKTRKSLKEEILSDMKGILDYVKRVNEVELEDVNANYSLYNVWREDGIGQREFSSELIKNQFPNAKDGFLKVKKIL